jgi:hypothetical protein
MNKPLMFDIFCGLGGWAEGGLDAGYDVIGFDIERHDYGTGGYPAQLVLQDALTIHGSQLRDADLIVCSPPCQEFSYMAMPWSRGKQIERALRGKDNFPDGYNGSRTIEELTALFDACFRIQREASEAAGRHIPMVVENVRGAQKWVGRARFNYGSFYLWGDVPALMPMVKRAVKNPDCTQWRDNGCNQENRMVPSRVKCGSLSVCDCGHTENDHDIGSDAPCSRCSCINPVYLRSGFRFDRISKASRDKHYDKTGKMALNSGADRSPSRKAASAMIAKIPFDLAHHIAAVYAPRGEK